MRLLVPGNRGVAFTSVLRATSKITPKATLLLFHVAVLLASGPVAVRAQSALDGFDPNANNSVLATVVQPDGKILLGGQFTALSPNGGAAVTRNRLARLNLDGSLETAFSPSANGDVDAIALQPDGKILVAGNFTTIASQIHNRIARVNSDGSIDTTFNPSADGAVLSIAVQADGKILIGGSFSNSGGQPRNHIARLNADGTLDMAFNPNANNDVLSIILQSDGKILVGGFFSGNFSIGNQTRNRIARLNPDGSVDGAFNPNANGAVRAMSIQADGKILAGGNFNGANSIGGQARNHIARLDPATGAADSFNPNADADPFTIVVQPDGKILAGGDFTMIGGQSRSRMARLDPTSAQADSFNPNLTAPSRVSAIAVQPDNKIVAVGTFFSLTPNGGATSTRNNIARLEIDGRLDQTLVTSFPTSSEIDAIAVQPDGKILVGGNFSLSLAHADAPDGSMPYLVRLNTNGTIDGSFNPFPSNLVTTIAVQPDGKILVGGDFTNIGGQPRNRIARLDGATGLADSFNPNANALVRSIAVQPDGKIVVAGNFSGFSSIGGQTRNGIARLDSATGLADSFNPDASNVVTTIALQPDGKILAGGGFTMIGGQMRRGLARLDAVTGAADSFDPNPSNNNIFAIKVQPDGKILVGGTFSTIGGQSRNNIARVDPASGLADSFNPNPDSQVLTIAMQADGKILAGGIFFTVSGQTRRLIARLDPVTGMPDSFNANPPGGTMDAIAVQADGKILDGGRFTGIGGQTRNSFARLTNDTVAFQQLTVTQSTIMWSLGGSTPQFNRVTFEQSSDNVNYTPLGNGIPQSGSSNWILAGLNLPTSFNFFIRARGYHNSGFENGSQSITENVRNVFLPNVPTVTSAVSRKTHGSAGTFDVDLPLSGTTGVECRSGGTTNDFTIVVAFAGNVTVTGNPQAQVTSGTGTIGNGGVSNGGMVSVSANVVTIPLTNIADQQTINVTLNGVNSAFLDQPAVNVVIPMSRLLGDTNGNRAVNASDVSQTKGRIGQPVTSANFRSDVNGNGSINSADVSLVKASSGHAVP